MNEAELIWGSRLAVPEQPADVLAVGRPWPAMERCPGVVEYGSFCGTWVPVPRILCGFCRRTIERRRR